MPDITLYIVIYGWISYRISFIAQ